jgi:predicted DNA-binding transcriptional regulator AlpA
MTTAPPQTAQRLLRTPDAALLLGLSARTLEKHRCYGTGPVYRKLGGRVVYTVEDLLSWADQGVRRSTSDKGSGTVHPAKPIDPSVLHHPGAVRR